VPTRHMARGARYAILDQVKAVEWASSTTSGVVVAAGAMLLPFYGQEYFESNVLCLSAADDAIRNTQALDPDVIARDVGLARYPFWPAAQSRPLGALTCLTAPLCPQDAGRAMQKSDARYRPVRRH
jgi:hypothetical protein